jgi:hypothetical protein
MVGRITSQPPAVNRHGVAWSDLYRKQAETYERLLAKYRLALELWLRADAAPKSTIDRRQLMAEARQETARALA